MSVGEMGFVLIIIGEIPIGDTEKKDLGQENFQV